VCVCDLTKQAEYAQNAASWKCALSVMPGTGLRVLARKHTYTNMQQLWGQQD